MKGSALVMAAVVAVLLILPSCGKKGDPLPPDVAAPAAVSHVDAEQAGREVALRWSIPEKAGDGVIFRIFRRELDNTDCPNCPQEYPKIADLAFADCAAAEVTCSYRDSDVKSGRIYGYRVAVCSKSGYCSAASDEVIIRYSGEGTRP